MSIFKHSIDGPVPKPACMQTYTGISFDLFLPSRNQVDIIDIAHGLSRICRFGGHTVNFYSVAEHSIHVAAIASTRLEAKVALMHDAHEAYLGDTITPLKTDRHRELEKWYDDMILYKYLTSGELKLLRFSIFDSVKALDIRMLTAEVEKCLSKPLCPWWSKVGQPRPSDLELIQEWDPPTAKKNFLIMFNDLFGAAK